ncbi:hypothetical protein TNCV_1264071 [Trichonephila clavipes]|nr:hypothetical protein TNCV_1264071 [Trichonephila clavipes]
MEFSVGYVSGRGQCRCLAIVLTSTMEGFVYTEQADMYGVANGNGRDALQMYHACQITEFFSGCDESVRNLSTNILRRLFGDYKFAYISNQLQKVNGICKVDRVFK